METRQFMFQLRFAHDADVDVCWYTLAGRRHGPFLSLQLAEVDMKARLQLWVQAATGIGGSVFRRSPEEVIVTLPKAVLTDRSSGFWPWSA